MHMGFFALFGYVELMESCSIVRSTCEHQNGHAQSAKIDAKPVQNAKSFMNAL